MLTVHGSHGDIDIDSHGFPAETPRGEYSGIVQFDLIEYAKAYPSDPAPSDFDILDLGYWYRTPAGLQYEPPEAMFRNGGERGQIIDAMMHAGR